MSSALMELETLSADQVARVMNMLDNMGLERILVTDPSGLILYDSLTQGQGGGGGRPPHRPRRTPAEAAAQPTYQYALFQEVALALQGNDVLYTHYEDGVFLSTAAAPIVYRGMIIGGIYICDWDNTQGTLLMSLQQNLRTISLVLMVIALLVSFFFSKVLTSRIGALLRAIRIVGEGEYGHRLQPAGKDELAHLAEEFNQLTDRLQTTEEVRRRFVSDASHELKTPLASIRLLADSILQNQEMDRETVQDFVSDIGEEAERLTRITEHLLALTRLDSLPVGETYIVDLSAVGRRAVSMLLPVADAAQVTIETTWKSGCTLRCTEDDLYQICFNLIENAVKYNFPGGKVFVSTRRKGTRCSLRWRTRASASRRRSCPRCSTASTGWTRPAPGRRGAPAWGCPSCGTRCAATGAGSPPSAGSPRAACSLWASPVRRLRWEVRTCESVCCCPWSGPSPSCWPAAAPAGETQGCCCTSAPTPTTTASSTAPPSRASPTRAPPAPGWRSW